jgi:type IV secretion system T-DNA border endonuclease VirD2
MSAPYPDEPDLIGAAGFIFQGPVRAKRSKVKPEGPLAAAKKASRSKALRRLLGAAVAGVARKQPEVMVKVSGAAKGAKHLREHLAYITRNGKLTAEVSDASNGGEATLLEGSADVRQLAAEWYARSGSDRRSNTRETVNMVLSMPAGTDRKALAVAAAAFARAEFGGKFDYILVNHEDTDHPHAHLTIRARNDRGQRLDPRKEDLQRWRERFAAQLRQTGVEAAATPRRARGVVQKATRQAIRHMDKRRGSNTTRWRIQQAVRTLQSERTGKAPDEPWRKAIADRQRKIRAAWGTVAVALERQGDVGLAIQVRSFIAAMPPVATQQDQMIERIKSNPQLLAKTERALQVEQSQERERAPRRK